MPIIGHEAIGLSEKDIRYVVGGSPMTEEQVINTLNNMLQAVNERMKPDLISWIKINVPKRTGQLQDDIIAKLNSTIVEHLTMAINLGSTVRYASMVNDMIVKRVAHSGEKGYAYYAGHTGVINLDDPTAVHQWWDKYMAHAHDIIVNILQRAIDEFFGGSGAMGAIRRKIG